MSEGYVNLRCSWILGCPAEIRPLHHGNNGPATEKDYAQGFQELFPGADVPELVAVGCCAQFAVTREKLRERPRADYERYRRWLLDTPLSDDISGRIMEYSWHSREQLAIWFVSRISMLTTLTVIFGRPPVHCPDAGTCYCRTFGYCNLTCSESQCDGRYTLPPYSTMPQGWPEKGWT